MDLDNRINLNVVGNLRGFDGTNPLSASNQGWGPWEINPQWVFTAQQSNTNHSPEWLNLFLGTPSPVTLLSAPTQIGRYGPNRVPSFNYPGNVAPDLIPCHFYARVDFDGWQEQFQRNAPGTSPSKQLLLPGAAPDKNDLPWTPYRAFPSYPGDPPLSPGQPVSYGDGVHNDFERRDHPLLFNPYMPYAGPLANSQHRSNRVLPLSNLEALLRYGDTGSPALTSELLRLCPQNPANPADLLGSLRRR
jgi:hypothetical protein